MLHLQDEDVEKIKKRAERFGQVSSPLLAKVSPQQNEVYMPFFIMYKLFINLYSNRSENANMAIKQCVDLTVSHIFLSHVVQNQRISSVKYHEILKKIIAFCETRSQAKFMIIMIEFYA